MVAEQPVEVGIARLQRERPQFTGGRIGACASRGSHLLGQRLDVVGEQRPRVEPLPGVHPGRQRRRSAASSPT